MVNKKTLGLIVLLNTVVISFCGYLVYYDLWLRRYEPIEVEWYLLGYRPTYHVGGTETRGSWTLDFLQLSIIVMAISDMVLVWQDRRERNQSSSP